MALESRSGLERLALISKAFGIPEEILFEAPPTYIQAKFSFTNDMDPELKIHFEDGTIRYIQPTGQDSYNICMDIPSEDEES